MHTTTTEPGPETPPTTERPMRQRGARAPDHVVAAALAVLAECDGSTREASRQTGIPESTLRAWRDGDYRTVSAQLALEQRAKRASKWDGVQDAAVGQVLARLPDASARDAAVVAAIAVDKAAILRGEATTITEHRTDDRRRLLEERYGQLRPGLQPTHEQDGTPLPPPGGEQPEPPAAVE